MSNEGKASSEEPQPPKPQPPSRPKVKSYLHKFYDCGGGGSVGAAGTPDERAENELRRLLASGGSGGKRRGGCHLRPIVWKAMLWIGVNCLIFGALGLAIAFFLPHEPELVEVPGVQGFVRSRGNAEWNRSAGVLKYVALGVFGLGAAITAIGLILPSLVWRLFDDEEAGSTSGPTGSAGGPGQRRLLQPRAKLAPGAAAPRTTTTMIACGSTGPPVDEKPVQPVRSVEEGHVSQGQVKVK